MTIKPCVFNRFGRVIQGTGIVALLSELSTYVSARHGVANRSQSEYWYDNGAVYLQPKSPNTFFDVQFNGLLYPMSGIKSVAIPSDRTLYFIYLTADGVLHASTSAWDILDKSVVSVVTAFRKSASKAELADQRHGVGRNLNWHLGEHRGGSRFISGLVGIFSASSISIDSGAIADADLNHNIQSQTASQIWYRHTGGASMTLDDAPSSVPYKSNAGIPQYDEAGTLTDVTNSNFVVNYFYAAGSDTPIKMAVGQAEYLTQSLARTAAQTIHPILAGLPECEWKLIYSVVIQRSGSGAVYDSAYDWRGINTGSPISPFSVPHSSLTGRDAANSHPISAITDLASSLASLVAGPASVVDNSIAVFSGTTGKLLKSSSNLIVDLANSLMTLSGADSPKSIIKSNSDTASDAGGVQLKESNGDYGWYIFHNAATAGKSLRLARLDNGILMDTCVWYPDGSLRLIGSGESEIGAYLNFGKIFQNRHSFTRIGEVRDGVLEYRAQSHWISGSGGEEFGSVGLFIDPEKDGFNTIPLHARAYYDGYLAAIYDSDEVRTWDIHLSTIGLSWKEYGVSDASFMIYMGGGIHVGTTRPVKPDSATVGISLRHGVNPTGNPGFNHTWINWDNTNKQLRLKDSNGRVQFMGLPNYVRQVLLTTGTVTNRSTRVYYNPEVKEASATITLPPAPFDSEECVIYFGPTIAVGSTVCDAMTIAANTGHSIHDNLSGFEAISGSSIVLQFDLTFNQWFRRGA